MQEKLEKKISSLEIFLMSQHCVRWEKHECISWISYAAEIKVLGQVTHVLQCLETGWQEVDGLAAITTSLFWLCALAYLPSLHNLLHIVFVVRYR